MLISHDFKGLRAGARHQALRHFMFRASSRARGSIKAHSTFRSHQNSFSFSVGWVKCVWLQAKVPVLLEGTPSIRRGNNQTWVSVCPHEFPSVLTLNQIQLAFLTTSLVTYSDFRLNIRSRGSSFAVLSSTSFHTCVILNNPCNKSFILYRS